jgi:hypothetical protein
VIQPISVHTPGPARRLQAVLSPVIPELAALVRDTPGSLSLAQGMVGLAGCLWLTLGEGTSLSDLRFAGLSREQQRVLQPQLAVLALMAALSNALAPFDLMVQDRKSVV